MLGRTQNFVVPVLFAGIALFYANEIWRSSKRPHTPTSHSRAEHAKYEAKHDNILADAWNWTTQDPVSFYTSALALFTGALVFVSMIQIKFLIRADKTATALATAAVSQSGIAGQQLAIIAAQADVQRKQHAIGRLQFFATHRPEIVVHAIELSRVPGPEKEDLYERIGALILCFNKGPTLADDVVVRGEILHTTNLTVDMQRSIVKTVSALASGQKLRFEIGSEWQIRQLAIQMRQGGPPFYCVGTISYFDENKIVFDDQPRARRETGFCFKLRSDARGVRWISAQSPEHEYAY